MVWCIINIHQTFRVAACLVASDTESEINGSKIKKLNVHFTESAELKDALKKASFKDATTMGKK